MDNKEAADRLSTLQTDSLEMAQARDFAIAALRAQSEPVCLVHSCNPSWANVEILCPHELQPGQELYAHPAPVRVAEWQPIEIGDHVRHEPTGEEWVVARISGDTLWWCGWPTGCTVLSECTLVEKASPESRAALIDELKRLPPSDSRHYTAPPSEGGE